MRNLLLLLLVVGCVDTVEHQMNHKSIEIHELSVQIEKKVERKIEKIGERAQLMEEPYKSQVLDSLETLKNELSEWQNNLVEVAGHEDHSHADHEHHTHESQSDLQLTPEMMLKVQKVIRDRIIRLNVHTQNILTLIDAYENDKSIKKEEKTAGYGT